MTDLKRIRQDIMIARERRLAKIQALDDYIGLVTSKLIGLALVSVGGLEALDPTFFPGSIPEPGIAFGAGLGLLVGSKVLKTIGKLLQTLSEGA